MSDQPNPSFIVIEFLHSSYICVVAKILAQYSPGEGGNPFTPLGGGRYVVSRAVSKKIRAAQTDPLRFLGAIPGVRLARLMRADQITALYGALDPADPTRTAGGIKGTAGGAKANGVPWHHSAIRVPRAWKLLHKHKRAAHVKQRKVAVIDTGYTGYTRHWCFGAWTNDLDSCFLVDAGENYVESGPPIDPVEDQYPGHPGHGTRVASVIAATHGFSGVAKGAKLVPYRVTRNVVTDNTTPHHTTPRPFTRR